MRLSLKEGQGLYEVVDGGCADGVDEVDGQLEEEDGEEEGGHAVDGFAC